MVIILWWAFSPNGFEKGNIRTPRRSKVGKVTVHCTEVCLSTGLGNILITIILTRYFGECPIGHVALNSFRFNNMIWIYYPTGFCCKTRKEMKDYVGKVSFFNAALRRGDIRYTTTLNCIAYDELQNDKQSRR